VLVVCVFSTVEGWNRLWLTRSLELGAVVRSYYFLFAAIFFFEVLFV